MSQIVGKFEEGWIRLISFSSLYISGHLILLSKWCERPEELTRHLIHDISRIEGTMAELLTSQTHRMQTHRHNLLQRIRYRMKGGVKPELLPYPPYQLHYDHHKIECVDAQDNWTLSINLYLLPASG